MFKRLRNFGLIVGAMLVALPCAGLTLQELEKSYESKCSEILNSKRDSLETLRKSYLGALKRIENKFQRAGRLDEVLLVKEESKSIENGKWPLSALPDQITLETNAPRKIYLRKHIEIEQQTAKELVQTADTMANALDGQVASLTKEGDLTNAKLAKTIRDNLDSNPDISAARKLLTNVRSDGSSRPALRIRRAGDNMEALVHYDMRGKVSLNSPVTNVEESDKSIGNTSAKVLGEFIGGKGFNVDPHVSFEKKFDDDELNGLVLTEIETRMRQVIEGTTGIALEIDQNAVNARISIPGGMFSKSTGGSTRITVSYFIPKGYALVKGFQFIHGGSGGSPFGGKTLDKTAKWITETLESEATSEEDVLLLYPTFDSTTPDKDYSKEPIFLGALKIERIRFSAFIIQNLGENSVITESFDEPSAQPRLATNGELVP